MKNINCLVLLTLVAGLNAAGADDAIARLERAGNVFATLTKSGHDIRAEQLDRADCVAVIPGFKKGAVVVGMGYGRGFVSCRNGGVWSAPAAIVLESGSLGVQIGGEEMDLVILSLDNELRTKLLSDRFAIGSDASAAWGNGKSAHDDPNAKILFFGVTKGAFAGFGLDGATLKPDRRSTEALYGRKLTNSAVVDGGTSTPDAARPFIAELTHASGQ
jgi:lipid-binding SYLF domain-containing protein